MLPDAPGEFIGDLIERQAIAADQQLDPSCECQFDHQVEDRWIRDPIDLSAFQICKPLHISKIVDSPGFFNPLTGEFYGDFWVNPARDTGVGAATLYAGIYKGRVICRNC